MSYQFYKVLHVFGIAMIILAFGAIIFQQMQGSGPKFKNRRLVMVTHGIGMMLVLVAGFGLMARIGLVGSSWPLWIWFKLALWLVFGGGVAFVLRKPIFAKLNWFLILALVALAASIANYKPQTRPAVTEAPPPPVEAPAHSGGGYHHGDNAHGDDTHMESQENSN